MISATGQVITSIVLNHTLFPPSVSLLTVDDRSLLPNLQSLEDMPSQSDSLIDEHAPGPIIPKPPAPVATPAPTIPLHPLIPNNEIQDKCDLPTVSNVLDFSTQTQCGRSPTKPIALVAGGTVTSQGDWPWLTAMYVVLEEYKFHCAGSLISNTHVITGMKIFL